MSALVEGQKAEARQRDEERLLLVPGLAAVASV